MAASKSHFDLCDRDSVCDYLLLYHLPPIWASSVFLLFTAECIAIGVLIYRMLYLMRSDYESTLAATNELIAGNFSYIQPKSAGMYQSLYNSLVDVKNEFQKALKGWTAFTEYENTADLQCIS